MIQLVVLQLAPLDPGQRVWRAWWFRDWGVWIY